MKDEWDKYAIFRYKETKRSFMEMLVYGVNMLVACIIGIIIGALLK